MKSRTKRNILLFFFLVAATSLHVRACVCVEKIISSSPFLMKLCTIQDQSRAHTHTHTYTLSFNGSDSERTLSPLELYPLFTMPLACPPAPAPWNCCH